ncbi:Protein of unknown function [Propionibacterium freudenreichii]|jgi:flavin-binding protein dodecin
MTRP